jgi:hypothetical protein
MMPFRTYRELACLRTYLNVVFFFSSPALADLNGRPHVAGLAALIMGQDGKLTPTALKQRIVALSALGVISGVPSSTTNTLGNNGATFV